LQRQAGRIRFVNGHTEKPAAEPPPEGVVKQPEATGPDILLTPPEPIPANPAQQ